MKPDSTTSFDYRLEKWISKQGLFFILTSGRGGGSIVTKLFGLLFKLLILAFIGSVFGWFYLKKKPETESFKTELASQIAEGMSASDVEIAAISRVNGGVLSGDIHVKSIKLAETEASFFKDRLISEYEVNADGTRTDVEHNEVASFNGVTISPVKITDNYFTGWSANNIKINDMELSLKTGADSDQEALDVYSSLFRKYESLNIKSISVANGTVYWGSSSKTVGSIKNGHFKILRNQNSWHIEVNEGIFSYAWLEDVELKNMKLVCDASGKVSVKEAHIILGKGELKFKAEFDIKAQPKVEGLYEFNRVNVLDLIGSKYEPWLGGQVKGLGTFSGYLNSVEGINYTTTITLSADSREENKETDSSIVIKGNKFPLLDVIQSVDLLNSYSKIRAHTGTVIFKYQGLKEISDVTINSVRCGPDPKGLILMNGEFQCSANDDIPFSLKEARSGGKQFDGQIKMGFLPKVFQGNLKLIEAFKEDEVVLRTQLNADIKGSIYNLTSKIAEELETVIEENKNNTNK